MFVYLLTPRSITNYRENVFENLKRDIADSREFVAQFTQTQEIYDFVQDWKRQRKERQISLEMGFYRETWLQMESFERIIESIPMHANRKGTIQIDTISFRNYLAELPKMVIQSIRHNVATTMESETKGLKEELTKIAETLEQLPSDLNIYVEQVCQLN